MEIKNLPQPSDISNMYEGEIFVKASTLNSFNTIKAFVDEHNLICFIESENKIYAQGKEYCGITPEQATEIAKIANIETSIQAITEKLALSNDNKSIIGALTYTIDDNGTQRQVQAPNVTQFVNAVVAAVQSGSYDISQQINDINTAISDINTLLNGFPVSESGVEQNVKDYVDAQLAALTNTMAMAIAQNATYVVGDSTEGGHISVSAIETVNPDTGDAQPPYIFKVEGVDIASAQDLSDLVSKIDSMFGDGETRTIQQIIDEELATQLVPETAKESLDTLKEIADWIQQHPDDAAAINTAINSLRTDLGDLTNDVNDIKDDYALKGNLYEPDGEGGERLKKTRNGITYGTTLEEINEMFDDLSTAKDVEDGAEKNAINAINVGGQSIKIKDTTVNFDDGNGGQTDVAEFLNASYDENERTIELGLNTSIFEQLNNLIIDTAVNTAVSTAVSQSQEYTDKKLSWIIA